VVFLSQLVGKPVRTSDGRRIAPVRDLVVRMGDDPYPPIKGVVAGRARGGVTIPADQVSRIDAEGVLLAVPEEGLQAYQGGKGDVLLGRHVLDHQLVDLDGRRVVRVSDVELDRSEWGYHVAKVDASPRAPLRRLGLRRFSDGEGERELVDWADVEYFASEAPGAGLELTHERLSQLSPADLARLVRSVSPEQGGEIMDSLDPAVAAETLEQLSPDKQADIVEGMDGQRAADVVGRMAPDDAADLLGGLDAAKARELLDLMEEEASGDVEDLLAYEADTAGGLMTPKFASATPEMSVGEAIEHIRRLAFEPELIYYVYVVDSLDYDTPLLLGIASLRDMILGGLERRMDEVMRTEVYHAAPDTPAEEVARVVGERDLLALPVLDDEGQILGIVTVDDVMETLLPAPWRQRLPRLFR
jgi:CBS domain-containing protein/sporulation protein YlmC with PRC-barrel domain